MPPEPIQLRSDSPRFRAMCEAVLAAGHRIRFRAEGASMQPNIQSGDLLVVAPASIPQVRRGDIVLSQNADGLRAHRIVRIDRSTGSIVTRGDAGLENDPPAKIVGRVETIQRRDALETATGCRAGLRHAAGIWLRRISSGVRHRTPGVSFFGFLLVLLASSFLFPSQAAAQADLAISSDAAAPNPVIPGNQITYTIGVVNNGGNTATSPSVTMPLPGNTAFSSATVNSGTNWSCNFTAPNVVCSKSNGMGSGTTASFTIVVTVSTTAAPGSTISQSVTINSSTSDPNLGNNTASASVQVASADLSMTQSVSASSVAPGSTITYTEIITNNGPNPAANAVLYQQTPPNTTFSSMTPPAGWTCGTKPGVGGTGQIICTDGSFLANGGSGTFTLVVTVAGGTAAGTVILNSADVTATTPDPVSTNNASTSSVLVEISGDADLGVTATASPTPVFISSSLTYTLTVRNLGLATAAAAQLVDTLPAGTSAASFSSSQGSCSGTTTVTCSFGAVTSGTTITVTIAVTTPASPGTLTNTATVSTATTDPVASNNTATTFTVVQPLVCASPGRDGSGGNLTGIVNAYYPATASATARATSIQLGAAAAGGAQAAIAAGDLLLVIQMQDAAINSTNTGAYGDGVPGDPGSGSTALNNAGNFEFVTATNAVAVTGGTLNFVGTNSNGGLLNSYTLAAAAGTQGQRSFQVIRVPQYTSATLSSTLAAMRWNGTTGGVLALDVASQITLGGTVSLDGVGFRGGAGRQLAGGAGSAADYITLATVTTNGSKGEGIAGSPRYLANAAITNLTNSGVEGLPNGSYARGAPGNAGGGATDARPSANDQNSGGGGGGNGGSGGQGGFGWQSAGIVGGYGGASFVSNTSSLIMGGGGGAGTTNNGTADPANSNPAGINSSGSAGGGIVIIHAGSVTGTGTISANGQNALNVANDGGGGGGAGGSIRVLANTGGLAGLTVIADGGNGGNTWLTQGPEDSFPEDRHGPGGGGGGGALFLSSAPGAFSVDGGAPGGSTTSLDPYGATIGASGILNIVSLISQTPGTQPGAFCASADLAVTNSGSPNPVLPGPGPGNIITYAQSVTNNGPLDALNATFTEPIPANTTFQSFNNPAGSGWTCSTPAVGGTGTITCTNPDVAKAATTNFTATVAVNSGVASGTVISDVVEATAGTNDSNLTNNSAMVQTTVALAGTADLSITNTAAPNPVLAGSNITYTVVVKNNGVAAASTVVFSEPIPANTTFVSVAPSPAAGWTCGVVAGTLSCSNPTVAAGASTTFTVVVKVNALTAAGTVISDTASVASSTTDPNPNNNDATATVVVATAGQSDFSVTSTASPSAIVTAGNNISYTQQVINNGPAAGAATFTDAMPPGTTFVSFTPPAGWNCGASIPPVGGTGTISCSIASLATNASANFPLVVKASLGDAPGAQITNTAAVNTVTCPTSSSTSPIDPNCANNYASTTVTVASPTQADIAILKTASPEPVNQGTNVAYTLQVTNNGPALAQGVSVTDVIPPEVVFVSVSTTQGACSYNSGATTVSCTLGNISVGGLVIITINATATTFSAATLSSNTARVAATTGDPNLTNNSSTAITTIATPTAVQLVSFRVAPAPQGGALLEWKTREEVRNLGFHVYRDDATGRRRLNPSLIAGSALVFRGGHPQHAAKTYQWLDPSPVSGATYWLEDVDLSGARILHGPAQFADSLSMSGLPLKAQLLTQVNQAGAIAAQLSPVRVARPLQPLPPPVLPPNVERVQLDRQPALKIFVRSEGWYHLSQARLAAAGFDLRSSASFLQLFAEGVEQPLLILGNQNGQLGPNDSVEFYGTGIDTPYSDARVYWLVNGHRPGKRVTSVPASAGGSNSPNSFPFTVLRQDRTTYFAALLNGEDQDNFFGAVITSAPTDQALAVTHSAPTDLPVTLDVALQGGTDNQAHAVSVEFNGALLGNINFSNLAFQKSTLPVDPSLLHDGDNTVTLAALNGENDVSVVQSIALHYAHTYAADANWLRMEAPPGSRIHLTGFTNPQIRVFDITNPLAIEQLAPSVRSTSSDFTADLSVPGSPAAGNARTLLAFSADQLAAAFEVAFHAASDQTERQQGADIIVVTHPDFASCLAPLVQLRREQGHSVQVVTIDEIFDAFNFGERSPYAMRDFFQVASTAWRRRPQSILLVGDASLDPRNYLGFGDFDFVPTRLVDTAALKTASDDWFTDFAQSGFGTVPIGRLPVRTIADAALVVSKIVNYERGSFAGAWNNQALVITDQDVDANFSDAGKSVAKSLSAVLATSTILVGDTDPQTARQQILGALNQGQLLVNYIGHGSVEQWSFSDLFDGADAASLQNGNALPVFILMDCLNGFFQDISTTSLAESLLLSPKGGAVAVWASAGFTDAAPQAGMNRALAQILVANPSMPLGKAVLQAKSQTGDQDVRRTWILFGDPAMRLDFPSAPVPVHPSSGGKSGPSPRRFPFYR